MESNQSPSLSLFFSTGSGHLAVLNEIVLPLSSSSSFRPVGRQSVGQGVLVEGRQRGGEREEREG
jgi:hypothetical protein